MYVVVIVFCSTFIFILCECIPSEFCEKMVGVFVVHNLFEPFSTKATHKRFLAVVHKTTLR